MQSDPRRSGWYKSSILGSRIRPYSWQSDTPGKTGHYLIRDALALERLAEDLALDEAERPELDHDTKGIQGAPPIMETILAKIDKSDVFVADVTLTGKTENDKPVINSNVAIELGYALKAVSGHDPLPPRSGYSIVAYGTTLRLGADG